MPRNLDTGLAAEPIQGYRASTLLVDDIEPIPILGRSYIDSHVSSRIGYVSFYSSAADATVPASPLTYEQFQRIEDWGIRIYKPKKPTIRFSEL